MDTGGIVRHFGFQAVVVAVGAAVVALQRRLDPETWQAVAGVYVIAVLAAVAVLLRHDRRVARSPSEDADGASLVSRLDTLPVGLRIIHSPAAVEGPVEPGAGDPTYRWFFRTEVHAIDRPVVVEHFGALVWDGRTWAMPGGAADAGLLGREEFAEWYGCADSVVRPGAPAVDDSNWAGSQNPTSFRQKWFFVGVDDTGTLVKGDAIVTLTANHAG